MKDQAARDELLSAYLDDQLDAEDRARLEAQLKTDPALRSELEMLRRTVTLVRDLHPQPIPRNFILPHTVVRKARPAPVTRRPKWLAPFLTAATTVVGLLFVVVLAGDLLFSGVGGMAQLAAPAPAADEGVVESAPVEKAVEEEEVPKMLTITESPEKEGEAPPESDETPLAMELPATPPPAAATLPEAPVEAEKVDVEPTPAPEGTPVAATGGGSEPAVESPAPTPTPAAAEEADAAARSDTPEAEEIAPVPPPEPAAIEPTERVLHDTEPAPNEVGEAEPLPGGREWGEYDRGTEGILFHVSPWRVAEVALGVFALLLVLITIWAWRARRR
jgi:hypothetical protein